MVSKSLCLVSVMLQRLPAVLSRIGIILASPLVRPPIALGRGHDFARYPDSPFGDSVRFDAIRLAVLSIFLAKYIRISAKLSGKKLLRISDARVSFRLERRNRVKKKKKKKKETILMPRGCNLSFSPYFSLSLCFSRSFVEILPLPEEKLVCTCKVLTAS